MKGDIDIKKTLSLRAEERVMWCSIMMFKYRINIAYVAN